ncbi:MAG: TIGR02147 family protein [Fibrobacter sp.]|jgi:uncharacterized protein (TIGR02147 family)|nr:TIGR02147 family protein [Fibrobacter sp.]MBQ5462734.1 TIGR02147 family protein [Fibrobacter sp.]
MKEILEYTSYRQYIADYYADKKTKSAFTWQEFANEAGFSSRVYLKYVSEGRFNLSESATVRVADAMRLADYEKEYFAEMVKFDHAEKDIDKKNAFNKMLSIADAHKVKIIEGDAFRFFESWKNPVIRELAPSMPGAKPLTLAHACRPNITAAEVSDVLNFLVKGGFLEKNDKGDYVQTDKSLTTGPMSVTPVAVRTMHRQMGKLALDAIEGVAQDKRNFSGVTFGITKDGYDEIVQEIADCRKKVVAIARKNATTDEVYRLNMQLFPLTQKQELKK